MFIDFKFYKDTYGGSVSEFEFPSLNIKAQAKVNYFTFGRIQNLYPIPESVKFAICETIDAIHEDIVRNEKLNSNEKRIASETVGSHSVSFKYNDEIHKISTSKGLDDKIYEICCTYLSNEQNLMYRGIE